MPIHPAFADHLHLLEDLPSFAGGDDPAIFARLDEFRRATTFGEPPVVSTRPDAAPGPHGPVPVRVYEPAGPERQRPCLIWMHGGAFMAGDLDMPEADWTAREIATRAGAVVVSVDGRTSHHPATRNLIGRNRDSVAAARGPGARDAGSASR